jgi:hypothetical protein
MATNPIYVETEEEIPEVVERLRRFNGEDTMLVLPVRSRIGQSRFNFQLLRNYAARMGKRVTVVCDDPAVQKMASESGTSGISSSVSTCRVSSSSGGFMTSTVIIGCRCDNFLQRVTVIPAHL